MADPKKILLVFLIDCLNLTIVTGQSTSTSTGGTATGSGGSVSYTVGQVAFNYYLGVNGSLNQGVQQPWEISVVTAIENTEGISLEMKVYPNPTSESLRLTVKDFNPKDLRYRLYDINGLLIQDKKIDSEETVLFLQDFPPSMYILKVIDSNKEVKVFKIVKQ